MFLNVILPIYMIKTIQWKTKLEALSSTWWSHERLQETNLRNQAWAYYHWDWLSHLEQKS